MAINSNLIVILMLIGNNGTPSTICMIEVNTGFLSKENTSPACKGPLMNMF